MDNYRAFVKSLKTLYHRDPKGVTLEKLQSLLNNGKITQDEYNYIIADEITE